jgi:hypothetical protein
MKARWTFTLAALGALGFACGSSDDSGLGSTGAGGSASGGTTSGGSAGSSTGGSSTGGSGGATGGSAGTAAGGSAGSSTGGAAGSPPVTCDGLESAYEKALAEAKVCENGPDPVIPCSLIVPNELACPCETFVNPNNSRAVSLLESLKAEWDAHSCGKNVACPEIACPKPASGVCSNSGGKGGHCEDVSLSGGG